MTIGGSKSIQSWKSSLNFKEKRKQFEYNDYLNENYFYFLDRMLLTVETMSWNNNNNIVWI